MYQLIAVDGPDSESFLQGQLTQDLRSVSPTRASAAAACSPKGRVLATMLLCRRAQGFELIVPANIANRLLQRLKIYKLRAKVELALRQDIAAAAVDCGIVDRKLAEIGLLPSSATNSVARSDDVLALRIDERVVAIFAPRTVIESIAAADTLDDDGWAAALIRTGQVSIGAENSEKFTPHMLSLDLAGAVSFDKGCYTGQEVVARTQHLGKSRRRLMRYSVDAATVSAGDELTLDGATVGTVVNAGGGEILAVTPQALHDETLQLKGGHAYPASLPWSQPAGVK